MINKNENNIFHYNKQSSSNYMINELCNLVEFVNFSFMTDTNYKFINTFLIYAKMQNKLSLRNSVKMDLYNVLELMILNF